MFAAAPSAKSLKTRAIAGHMLLGLTVWAADVDRQAPDNQPPFCAATQKHQVIAEKDPPGPVLEGKARVYVFWKGMRWRWWSSQCKVALNGSWAAVLSPNTYSVMDVAPGKLRFCGAGTVMGKSIAPTWRSLLFVHATAGETYYIECSPGVDDVGAAEPTLSEPEQREGKKAVSKYRRVRFMVKPER